MNWASTGNDLQMCPLNQKLPSLWAAHNSFSRFNTVRGEGFKRFTKERVSPDNSRFITCSFFVTQNTAARGGGRLAGLGGAVFGWGGRAGWREAGVTEGLWKTSLDKVRGILQTVLGFIEDWVWLSFNLWNNWWLRGFQGWEGNWRGRVFFLFCCLQVIITRWSHHGRM